MEELTADPFCVGVVNLEVLPGQVTYAHFALEGQAVIVTCTGKINKEINK